MRAGRMRHRISIMRPRIEADGEGAPDEHWQEHCRCWAAMEPLNGREYFESGADQAEVDVRFRLRWRDDISPDMEVRLSGRKFRIVSPPIDVMGRQKEMQLMCSEIFEP